MTDESNFFNIEEPVKDQLAPILTEMINKFCKQNIQLRKKKRESCEDPVSKLQKIFRICQDNCLINLSKIKEDQRKYFLIKSKLSKSCKDINKISFSTNKIPKLAYKKKAYPEITEF